jgi:dodecin
MSDHVYKTIELTGSSTVGVDDAVRRAIERASKSMHNLRWFEITQVRGHIDGGAVAHWQVTIKVGFTLDE